MRTLTKIKSAAVLLLLAGLLLSVNNRWGAVNSQEGMPRDKVQRPSKTFDDRRKHTIKLVVRYRPARQVTITWGIGERGGSDQRMARDRASWQESDEVWEGTPANVTVDNFDQGGYLYCAIEQDNVIMREYRREDTEYNDSCDLTFVVGGR